MPPKTVFAALAILSLLTGCRKQDLTNAASDPPSVLAAVVNVETETLPLTIAVTGTLISKTRVDIKAEVIGHISRFDKQEGDPVRAGEPVVWVDDENARLALRQAESAVEVAEAGLERTRLIAAHSRSERERADNLLKSGGITDKDLKSAELADRDSAAQVLLAQAQQEQARAALEVARKHVRDTVIYAPIAGVIQHKMLNKGAYVEAPTALFSIVDNRQLELESPVASADLASVHSGQPVTFKVNSYPGVQFEGRVLEINPALDEQTRSAKVRVQVANLAGKLKAGMFAQGEILTGMNTRAIVIPLAAVYRDDRSAKASSVFVVEQGKACRRAVRIGHERDSSLEIVEGLRPGEQLIAEQNIEIAEGVSVEPRK